MPSFLPSENALFLPFLKSFYALLKCPPFFPPKMPSFFLRKCPLFFPPKMPSVCPSLKTPLKLFVPILNWCPLCKTFWYHLYLRLPVWGLLKIHVLPLMCILSNLVGKFIVYSLNTHSGEKTNATIINSGDLRRHLKAHSGERSNKCNQCDFAFIQAGNLRPHLKLRVERSQTNATDVTLHL